MKAKSVENKLVDAFRIVELREETGQITVLLDSGLEIPRPRVHGMRAAVGDYVVYPIVETALDARSSYKESVPPSLVKQGQFGLFYVVIEETSAPVQPSV